MAVEIEQEIPIPGRRGGVSGFGRPARWPWRQMKTGDSFFAAGYVQNMSQRTSEERTLGVGPGKKIIPGSEWTTRLVTENGQRGVRVWRVK